jgi:hypothetical protein
MRLDSGSPNNSSPAGSAGDARRRMNDGDARQVRNQAGELANDAQNLRRQLQTGGGTQTDLRAIDDVLKALRELESSKNLGDPVEMQQLTGVALDKLKKLEFDLRKRVDTTNNELFLSGSEEVPARSASQIYECFRQLAKKAGGGK